MSKGFDSVMALAERLDVVVIGGGAGAALDDRTIDEAVAALRNLANAVRYCETHHDTSDTRSGFGFASDPQTSDAAGDKRKGDVNG